MGEKLSVFLQISEYFRSSLNLEEVISRVITCTKDVIHVEAATLFLLDETSTKLVFFSPTGEKADELKGQSIDRNTGIVGQCVNLGQDIVVNDVQSDIRFSQTVDDKTNFETRSILCVPIKLRDKIIGALEVINKLDGEDFSEDDVLFTSVIANQASIAIENSQFYENEMKQAKLASIGHTVTELAHCIKNIVNIMEAGSYFIRNGFESEDMPTIKKGWAFFESNYTRLNHLVMDMLTFSKERKPEYKPVIITELLQELGNFVQKSTSPKPYVHLFLDTAPKLVKVDETSIYRALLNLLTNALDAARQNEQEELRLEIRCEQLEDHFIIRIKDNGPGIPEELLPNIFTPFFSTKGANGTGFGLAVVQKIVDEHKGKIFVTSQVGSGTEFRMILPAGDVPQSED